MWHTWLEPFWLQSFVTFIGHLSLRFDQNKHLQMYTNMIWDWPISTWFVLNTNWMYLMSIGFLYFLREIIEMLKKYNEIKWNPQRYVWKLNKTNVLTSWRQEVSEPRRLLRLGQPAFKKSKNIGFMKLSGVVIVCY